MTLQFQRRLLYLGSIRCGVYVSDVDRRVNHGRRRSFDRVGSLAGACCCTSAWVVDYVVANCRLQHKPSHHPLVVAVLILAILQISATSSHLWILPHPANDLYFCTPFSLRPSIHHHEALYCTFGSVDHLRVGFCSMYVIQSVPQASVVLFFIGCCPFSHLMS